MPGSLLIRWGQGEKGQEVTSSGKKGKRQEVCKFSRWLPWPYLISLSSESLTNCIWNFHVFSVDDNDMSPYPIRALRTAPSGRKKISSHREAN